MLPFTIIAKKLKVNLGKRLGEKIKKMQRKSHSCDSTTFKPESKA
jgi:hypothetical protein